MEIIKLLNTIFEARCQILIFENVNLNFWILTDSSANGFNLYAIVIRVGLHWVSYSCIHIAGYNHVYRYYRVLVTRFVVGLVSGFIEVL
jgi:hypothetical protein